MREALAEGRLKRLAKLLHRTHPAKVAGLLEALPPDERRTVWSMVETERAGKVLTYLHEEICAALAEDLDPDDLAASVQTLALDDLVDLIQSLPGEIGARLLAATGGSRRQQLEALLSLSGRLGRRPDECRSDRGARGGARGHGVALPAPARRTAAADRHADGGGSRRHLPGRRCA